MFIGIVIGIAITIIGIYIKNYLKRNNLVLNTKFIISTIIIIHLIYSVIGILFAPEYTKPNGNVCTGFNYGINVCGGDVNAE